MAAPLRIAHTIALAITFTTCLTSAAFSADLGLTASELAKAYNKTAKSLDIDNRIARGSCETGVKYVCQYNAGSGIAMMSTSPSKEAKIEDITIIYASGETDDVINYVSTVGVLMALLSPDADRDERGAALSTLLKGISGGETSTAYLNDTRFEVRLPKGLGVWTFVTREAEEEPAAATK